MCDFLSWKTYNGETYVITDKEVRDKKTQKYLKTYSNTDYAKEYAKEDVLGHGYINKYFGLGGKGYNCELSFSDKGTTRDSGPNKYILSLIGTRDALDNNFSYIFKEIFSDKKLIRIYKTRIAGFKHISDKARDEIAKRLSLVSRKESMLRNMKGRLTKIQAQVVKKLVKKQQLFLYI